jgi:hypothetical protein
MNHLRSAGGHILQTTMKFLVEMPIFLAALFTMHAMGLIFAFGWRSLRRLHDHTTQGDGASSDFCEVETSLIVQTN